MKPGEAEFYITIRARKNADSVAKAGYHTGVYVGEPLSLVLNGLAGR
jgi:hypothetical protein